MCVCFPAPLQFFTHLSNPALKLCSVCRNVVGEKILPSEGGKQLWHLKSVNWQINAISRWKFWNNPGRVQVPGCSLEKSQTFLLTGSSTQLSLKVEMTVPGKQGAGAKNFPRKTTSSLEPNHSFYCMSGGKRWALYEIRHLDSQNTIARTFCVHIWMEYEENKILPHHQQGGG